MLVIHHVDNDVVVSSECNKFKKRKYILDDENLPSLGDTIEGDKGVTSCNKKDEGNSDANPNYANDDDIVYAHRIVLHMCAPGLAMLCEPYDDLTPVPIFTELIHSSSLWRCSMCIDYPYHIAHRRTIRKTSSMQQIDMN